MEWIDIYFKTSLFKYTDYPKKCNQIVNGTNNAINVQGAKLSNIYTCMMFSGLCVSPLVCRVNVIVFVRAFNGLRCGHLHLKLKVNFIKHSQIMVLRFYGSLNRDTG